MNVRFPIKANPVNPARWDIFFEDGDRRTFLVTATSRKAALAQRENLWFVYLAGDRDGRVYEARQARGERAA